MKRHSARPARRRSPEGEGRKPSPADEGIETRWNALLTGNAEHRQGHTHQLPAVLPAPVDFDEFRVSANDNTPPRPWATERARASLQPPCPGRTRKGSAAGIKGNHLGVVQQRIKAMPA